MQFTETLSQIGFAVVPVSVIQEASLISATSECGIVLIEATQVPQKGAELFQCILGNDSPIPCLVLGTVPPPTGMPPAPFHDRPLFRITDPLNVRELADTINRLLEPQVATTSRA
jgi:hypothetical protein